MRNMRGNFIEIELPHGCSTVNLLHIFRTPFHKNTTRGLLLKMKEKVYTLNIYPYKQKNVEPTGNK